MTNDNSTLAETRKEERRENAVNDMAFDLSLHPVIAAFAAYEKACEEWENDTPSHKIKRDTEESFVEHFIHVLAVKILNRSTTLEEVLTEAADGIVE